MHTEKGGKLGKGKESHGWNPWVSSRPLVAAGGRGPRIHNRMLFACFHICQHSGRLLTAFGSCRLSRAQAARVQRVSDFGQD